MFSKDLPTRYKLLDIFIHQILSTKNANQLTYFKIYLLVMYNVLSACIPAHQMRAPDLITDGCEPPCGCRELNLGPLEESVLLTAEPSLKPHRWLLFEIGSHVAQAGHKFAVWKLTLNSCFSCLSS